MLTLLFWVVGIIAHTLIGYRLAVWNTPRSWAVAREAWSDKKNVRDSARTSFMFMILAWGLWLPWVLFRDFSEEKITQLDPKEMQKKIDAFKNRTHELERELNLPLSKF